MKNSIIKLVFALTAAFTVFSCDVEKNSDPIVKSPSIAEIAVANPDLSSLVQALTVTDLAATFTNAGSYTVFAPTNTAFNGYTSIKFPAGITQTVLTTISKAISDSKLATPTPIPTAVTDQINELKKILQYHVVSIGTLSNDLIANEYSKTFAPGINTTAANGTLSLFVNKSGTDVLVNGGMTNSGAKVITADINASNGIIHVIDNVLKLPTLVSHVKANPKLSTLLAIVTSTTGGTYGDQTAIATALTSAGTTAATALTLYAPMNNAVTAATTGSGFFTGVIATPANITKLLQYHVENLTNRLTATSGQAFSTSDIAVSTLLTPQKFTITKNVLKIKDTDPSTTALLSSIKNINIQATNGVIHTIDQVLKPVL